MSAPIFAMLRSALVEAEGVERELAQARADVVRLAEDNQQQCDEIEALRAQVSDLENQLAKVREA